jgi:hypothetical protein
MSMDPSTWIAGVGEEGVSGGGVGATETGGVGGMPEMPGMGELGGVAGMGMGGMAFGTGDVASADDLWAQIFGTEP